MNLKKIITLTLVFSLCFTVLVNASSWGNLATISLKWNDSWKTSDARSYKMKNNDSNFDVLATSKTMTSNPSVRLANSNGEKRSSSVSVKGIDTVYTGSNNTGTNGYYYYGQAKPAWNQVGTDSMKFQVNAR
ncbi:MULTISPECIES: hypothetical protein [unclassified Virgibacillus]|uniref:hypothetical protein n=1 Tax=unclassified Virgibacillus TaxID=2620237 RepID=UPI0024DE9B34|nr:hypothetical protein [Virgibacillus sp. LDC-1]